MADEIPREATRLVLLRDALRSGALSLEAHVDEILARVDALEPRLRALIPEPERHARLGREVAALQGRYPDPSARPPLFGVLVAVKDIISVDGLPTRAGSALPPASFAAPEATVVERLRAAGALILAKTVTTEFAYADPGATVNPYHPGHTPGGSSSGSAAAVAVGLAPLALGSQTVGSVIRPAAFCGVVGFKPSYGRIPTDGVLYFSRSVDHVGLFAQDAEGVALAAREICDDWRDVPGAGLPVLGIPVGPYLEQALPDALRAFYRSVERLRAQKYDVREVPALEDIDAIGARHVRLMTAEFAREHEARYRAHGSLFRPMSAMLIDAARGLDPAVLEEGRTSIDRLRRELESRMDAAGIDAWISPAATGPAPPGLAATGSPAMSLGAHLAGPGEIECDP
jgi:Asp-tRNA(Asn)/Glu-tRNA(Gln) amidotransferase A subunit family amidase